MKEIHPINIICTVGTLLLCAALIVPFIIILVEYIKGNRKESLFYEMLHTHPYEEAAPKFGTEKITRYDKYKNS